MRRRDDLPGYADMSGRTFPASTSQARFWRHEQLSERSGASNSLATLRFSGPLDVARLAASFRGLIDRHEILRTRFEQRGSTLLQVVEPSGNLHLACVDLTGVSAYGSLLDAIRVERLRRAFDMSKPSLLELVLLRLGDAEHILIFVIHHIISDGWSQGLLIDELLATYRTGESGRSGLVPQYSEYTQRERERLQSEDFRRETVWWRAYLNEAAPTALSNGLSGVPGVEGRKHQITVSGTTARKLLALGSDNRATLTNVLVAALLLTLKERTGCDELLIGLLSGLRTSAASERTLGCMTNLLCLRASIEDCEVTKWIGRIRDQYLDVIERCEFPFEHAASLLPPNAGSQIEIVYVAQAPQRPGQELDQLKMSVLEFGQHVPAFPLVVMSTPFQQGVEISLEYDLAYFRREEILAFGEHLQWTLSNLPHFVGRKVSDIGRAFVDSQRRVVVPRDYGLRGDGPRAIDSDFLEWAARSGPALAVIDGSDSVTYRQLDEWAACVAAAMDALRPEGKLPVVAVACARSIGMIAGWLAVARVGGVCVPIDLGESAAELRRRLRWVDVSLILSDSAFAVGAADLATSVPILNVDRCRHQHRGAHRERPVPIDSAVAYVCFTSGSTGTPSAVAGTHAATVNRIRWLQDHHAIVPQERCAVRTSVGFVDAIAETYGPLSCGATLVLCDASIANDPAGLVHAIREQDIRRVTLTPSLLRSMVGELQLHSGSLHGRRIWHVSGEPLPCELLAAMRAVRPQDTLLNLYGSTEVAADISCGDLSHCPADDVHVGGPISNCNLFILDRQMEPTPRYVEGDVYAVGVALSHGYLHDVARTADRFVPSLAGVGERMYRTGDRGYWRLDGNLQLVGRRDRQIKRRGVRIALDGVESRLECLPDVATSAVFWHPDSQWMVACVTFRSSIEAHWIAFDEPNDDTLRVAILPEELEQRLWTRIVAELPVTSLPDRLFALERFPLTSAGKIRYERLNRVPWHIVQSTRESGAERPTTATERILVEICERILRTTGVISGSRFLELGMTSLQLVQVLHAVAEEFGVRLRLSQLYSAASLRQCAELIDAEIEAVAAVLEALE